jgi:type III secretion protein D
MKRDQLLELRIVSGTHAGARVPLPESPQVLGSSGECDLILSDEGVSSEHVRISIAPDGEVLVEWLGESPGTLTLQPGQGVKVGPVGIAIELADAPWRTDLPMLVAPDEHKDDSEPLDSLDSAAVAGQAGMADEPVPPTSRKRPSWGLGVVAVAALVASGTWWQAGKAPAVAASTAPPTSIAPMLHTDQVKAVLAATGLSDRVRIELGAGRLPIAHAAFLTDEQAEALALALSRLNPRPGLRLISEEDVRQAVSDELQRQAATDPLSLRASYLGEGRFRIEGRVRHAQDKAVILQALRAAAPDVRSFEAALLTDAEAATALVDELHRLGIEQIKGHWTDGVLTLKVRMPGSAVALWERALTSALTLHPLPLRATLEWMPVRVALEEPLPPAPSIRSVVGGEQPYVVLADGNKLMVDGRTEQWRLVQIAARSVVFETHQGRRMTVER